MLRSILIRSVLLGGATLCSTILCSTAHAADACAKVSEALPRENVLMHDPPRPQAANPGPLVIAFLQPGTLYELDLLPQNKVIFAAKPEKAQPVGSATAGLMGIKVPKAGRYRVMIATSHWLDLVEGKALLKPLKRTIFQGCERPRAVAEYQLEPGREYRLQLSGATAEQVLAAVTAVEAAQ